MQLRGLLEVRQGCSGVGQDSTDVKAESTGQKLLGFNMTLGPTEVKLKTSWDKPVSKWISPLLTYQ